MMRRQRKLVTSANWRCNAIAIVSSVATICFLCPILATQEEAKAQTELLDHQRVQQFQSVDSYLAQFLGGASELNTGLMKLKLNEAIETIESGQLTSNENSLAQNEKFVSLRPLIEATKPTDILLLLNQLNASIGNTCSQSSVEFLVEVIDSKAAFGEQPSVLQTFASKRLEECWRDHVKLVAKKIQKGLGKMSAPIFETIHSMVNTMFMNKAVNGHKPRNRNLVTIGNNDDESGARLFKLEAMYSRETLDRLRSIHFDKEIQRRLIGVAMKKMFDQVYGEDPKSIIARNQRMDEFKRYIRRTLVEPCSELERRVKVSFVGSQMFEKHVRQTLGNSLTDLAGQADDLGHLEHDLIMLKICMTATNRKNLENELVAAIE